MRWVLMSLLVVMTGCGAGIDVYYGADRRMVVEHEVSVLRPSFTKVTTEICVPQVGVETVDIVDGKTYRCEGTYVAQTAPNFAAQEGSATGIGSAVVLGGAAVGTGYVFGASMPSDDYNTTNNTSSDGGSQSQGQVQGQQQSQQSINKLSSSSSSKSSVSQPQRRH